VQGMSWHSKGLRYELGMQNLNFLRLGSARPVFSSLDHITSQPVSQPASQTMRLGVSKHRTVPKSSELFRRVFGGPEDAHVGELCTYYRSDLYKALRSVILY